MPQMPFPSVLAFVEGSMEALFINSNFKYVRVVPVKNGCKWTVDALCEQVRTFFKARNFGGDHVVIWIDRENRPESSEYIVEKMKNVFEEEGYPINRVAVMVCDRMTENVILADEDFIRSEFGVAEYAYVGDGKGGKFQLSSLCKDAGLDYKETFHGVRFLKKIRLDNAALVSASVARFRADIQIPCWWFS